MQWMVEQSDEAKHVNMLVLASSKLHSHPSEAKLNNKAQRDTPPTPR